MWYQHTSSDVNTINTSSGIDLAGAWEPAVSGAWACWIRLIWAAIKHERTKLKGIALSGGQDWTGTLCQVHGWTNLRVACCDVPAVASRRMLDRDSHTDAGICALCVDGPYQ